jgi:hypothetical protein
MEKIILGRLVEYSVADREIYIHLSAKDREKREKELEELGYKDDTSDTDTIAEYFSSPEFREIHDEVFPSGQSWEMDNWNDEDRTNYITVLIEHPDDEKDE